MFIAKHSLIGDWFRDLVDTEAAISLTYVVFHVEFSGLFQIIEFLCARNIVFFFLNGTIFGLTSVELVGRNIFVRRTILHTIDQSESSRHLAVKSSGISTNQRALATSVVIVWAGASVNNKSDKFLTLDSVAKFGFFYMFQKSHSYK